MPVFEQDGQTLAIVIVSTGSTKQEGPHNLSGLALLVCEMNNSGE
jgi:hypothetical protein